MRRFWVDASSQQGDGSFLIKGQLYHHIVRVCGIKKQEPFLLLKEGQKKYCVHLVSISQFKARAEVIEEQVSAPCPKPFLHLALSLPRPDKLAFLVEKSVELGVKGFHPFFSDLSFKKQSWDAKRQARLENLINKSLACADRTDPFHLSAPQQLKDIRIPPHHLAFMAYEQDSNPSFKEVLASSKSADELWLFVGSEGGFSQEEARFFSENQGEVVSLGQHILRVETACLMGLSILKYHYHM